MSESVIMLWIRSMHACGTVPQAMASLTENTHSTSCQHKELGISRIKWYNNDLQNIRKWFEEVQPFNENREELFSLSAGLTANESVDCDDVEAIGQRIQEKMDGQNFVKCSIKRSDHVKTLGSMKNIVSVD